MAAFRRLVGLSTTKLIFGVLHQRWPRVSVPLLQDFLKRSGGPGSVIGLVVVINDMDLTRLGSCIDSAIGDLFQLALGIIVVKAFRYGPLAHIGGRITT